MTSNSPSGIIPGEPSQSNVIPFPPQYQKNTPAAALLTPNSNSTLPVSSHSSSDMAEQTREEVQARIRESAAQTETKIATLSGRLETLDAKLSGKLDAIGDKISVDHEYNRSTRWVMIGLAVGLAAVIVAMATYGDAMFGRGMNVHDVIQATIKETQDQSRPAPTTPPTTLPSNQTKQ